MLESNSIKKLRSEWVSGCKDSYCQWWLLLHSYRFIPSENIATPLSAALCTVLKLSWCNQTQPGLTQKYLSSCHMTWNMKFHKALFKHFHFLLSFDSSFSSWVFPWSRSWCSCEGTPLSAEHISMEPTILEPSVSLHLATRTRAAFGITAFTFHHSIKDFPVSCTARAGGGSPDYSSNFLSFLPL